MRFTLLASLSVLFSSTLCQAQEIDDHLLWANIGPSSYTQSPQSATYAGDSDIDSDRNNYIIGTFRKVEPSLADPTQQSDYRYIMIVKYDKDGDLVWTKEIGNQTSGNIPGKIRVDVNGDIIFDGLLYDPNGSMFGVPLFSSFLAKLDKNGNLIWIKDAAQGMQGSTSGSEIEIAQDNTIVMYHELNPHSNNATSGLYISRYSSSGLLLARHQITRDDNYDRPILGGLAVDALGDIIVTGSYYVSIKIGPRTFGVPGDQGAGPVHLFIAKYSAAGVFVWARAMDNPEVSNGYDVETDPGNIIYLTGVFAQHATFGSTVDVNPTEFYCGFIAKLSPAGDLTRIKTFTPVNTPPFGMTYPLRLKRTSNGSFYLSGHCHGGVAYDEFSFPRSAVNAFVMKLNPDTSFAGAIVSDSKLFGITGKSASNSTIDRDGNIYTIGNFDSSIVFGCDTLSAVSSSMFMTKYGSFPPVYNVALQGPSVVCKDIQLKLTGTDIPQPVKYYWILPPGVTNQSANSNSNILTASVAPSANSQDITFIVRKGCYNYQSTVPYKIIMQYQPGFTYVNGQDLFCDPGEARYAAGNAEYATGYVWTLPSGISPKENKFVTSNPGIDVNIQDSFDQGLVFVRSKNECGEGLPSNAILVKLLKKPEALSFVNEPSEFCNEGQAVTVHVVKSDRATEYNWNVPSHFKEVGIIKSNANQIVLTLKTAGHGTITVFGKNSCHQGVSSTLEFTVSNPLPEPQIEKNECGTELLVAGEGTEIKWYRDNVLIAEGSKRLNVFDPGLYSVTMSNFCGVASSNNVAVLPIHDHDMSVPNVITPNGDGKNDVLNLGKQNLILEIFGRWGNSIYRSDHYQNDWDGQGLPTGVYYFQFKHECLEQQYQGWLQIIR